MSVKLLSKAEEIIAELQRLCTRHNIEISVGRYEHVVIYDADDAKVFSAQKITSLETTELEIGNCYIKGTEKMSVGEGTLDAGEDE